MNALTDRTHGLVISCILYINFVTMIQMVQVATCAVESKLDNSQCRQQNIANKMQ